MRKILGAILWITVALALQVVLSTWLPWLSARVDLLLVVVVYYGVGGSQEIAMLTGAASGLLQDIWFGGIAVGANAFRKTLAGYLIGAVGARFAFESTGAYAIALVLGSMLDHVIGIGLGGAIGIPRADPFSWIVLERAFANAVIGSFCAVIFKRISRARAQRATDRTRRGPARLRAGR